MSKYREGAAFILSAAGWGSGVIAYLKYLFLDTEQTAPIHFMVLGCWMFLGAITLRRRRNGESNG